MVNYILYELVDQLTTGKDQYSLEEIKLEIVSENISNKNMGEEIKEISKIINLKEEDLDVSKFSLTKNGEYPQIDPNRFQADISSIASNSLEKTSFDIQF